MKIKSPSALTLCFSALLLVSACVTSHAEEQSASAYLPLMQKPTTLEQAEAQAQKLVQAMTPEERFDLVRGGGMHIKGIKRLGIPEIQMMDATAGYRLTDKQSKEGVTSTAFPCPLLLAATWDMDRVRDYAAGVAEEFRAHGIHFILGPAQNIYRNSKCGRNFEYLGEDPYLVSNIISNYVRAAESLNVGITLKHFIANETEIYRRGSNSVVNERALHEIYLPPFKKGVEAGAWAVMTSYNLVNGEWAAESRSLVTDVLRKQLGFNYLVMSDWDSCWHGEKLIKSGLDLEMPDGYSLAYDRARVLGSPEIDRMAASILKTCIMSGLYELELKGDYLKSQWLEKYPQHAEAARKVNAEGIVLLKNNGILPLETAPAGKILVTGTSATREELSGGGSSQVKGYQLKTYLQAVQQRYGEQVVFEANPTDEQIRSAGLVLLFTGRLTSGEHKNGEALCEAEGYDHTYELPEDALIARCVRLNPKTVVNLVCGGGTQMDWADQAAAVVLAFYGGQTGADVLVDILNGKINPSGKLPCTIEKRFEDSCAAGYMPARSIPTHTDPSDLAKRVGKRRAPAFCKNKDSSQVYTYDVNYAEGVFVGYRWYDAMQIEPRFPFGYGLSYTTFEYSDLKLSAPSFMPGAPLKVEATIKNTGKREGAEVAQLYVSELNPVVPRPPRELKGFQRVNLKPGEAKTVSFELNQNAFSYYDEALHDWKMNPGDFQIQVGASSRDLRLKAPLTVAKLP